MVSDKNPTALPVPVSRTDAVAEVQQRIRDASNVKGFFERLAFSAAADNAVWAMRAQVKHAQAVVECVDQHAQVLSALDRFFEVALQTQMKRDLATEIYTSRADDERERFLEAEHKRTLSRIRREKEEL